MAIPVHVQLLFYLPILPKNVTDQNILQTSFILRLWQFLVVVNWLFICPFYHIDISKYFAKRLYSKTVAIPVHVQSFVYLFILPKSGTDQNLIHTLRFWQFLIKFNCLFIYSFYWKISFYWKLRQIKTYYILWDWGYSWEKSFVCSFIRTKNATDQNILHKR